LKNPPSADDPNINEEVPRFNNKWSPLLSLPYNDNGNDKLHSSVN